MMSPYNPKYILFCTLILIISKVNCERDFNTAFASSVFVSLQETLNFPWQAVGNLAALFDSKWKLAYTGDKFEPEERVHALLKHRLDPNSTLHYIWTIVKPLSEPGVQHSIDMLYAGFENGGFHGYQRKSNCPGIVVTMKSNKTSCPGFKPKGYLHQCRKTYAAGTNCKTGTINGEVSSVRLYDPKVRPWYQAAISASSGLAWSPTYVFASAGTVGLTAARKIVSADGVFLGVIGADYMLSTLDEVLAKAVFGQVGYTLYLVDTSGLLISASEPGVAIVSNAQVPAVRSANAVVRATAVALASAGWAAVAAKASQVLAVSVPKRGIFLANVKELADARGLRWYLVVAQQVQCDRGFFSLDRAQLVPVCQPCPAFALCPGGTWLPYPTRGHWALLDSGHPEYLAENPRCLQQENCQGAASSPELLECFSSAFAFTTCNATTQQSRKDPSLCSPGSKGRLCGVCSREFYLTTTGCKSCPKGSVNNYPFDPNAFWPMIGALALAFMACGAYFVHRHYARLSASMQAAADFLFAALGDAGLTLKILQNTLQIVSSVNPQVGVARPWPNPFFGLAQFFEFLSLDVMGVLPSQCITPEFDFYTHVLQLTLAPLAVVALLSLLALAPALTGISTVRAKYWQILVMNLALPIVTVSLVKYFVPVTFVDGSSYLAADLSVEVTMPGGIQNSKWRAFSVYVILMLIVYPFGTPLYFAWEVFSNRQAILDPNRILKEARSAKDLRERNIGASGSFMETSSRSRPVPNSTSDPRDSPSLAHGADRTSNHVEKWSAEETDQMLVGIAFLFESYKLSTFTLYAEVLDVYRRIVLCSLVVFSGTTAVARCLWGIGLATCWLQIFDWYRPYRTARANTLAHFCNVTILATFIAAFLLEDAPVDPEGLQLGWLLLFLNITLFGLACSQLRSEQPDESGDQKLRGAGWGLSQMNRNSSALGMADETVMTTNNLFQLRELSMSATLDAERLSDTDRTSGISIVNVVKDDERTSVPERGEQKSWGAPGAGTGGNSGDILVRPAPMDSATAL